MQDMIVSVYESKIINQQISYYILKEEYENEKTGFVNEGFKEAGAWIKNKVTAFVKLIKSWIEKLGNLIKRIFKWITGAVNKVLVFLKLKKKPEEIDCSKMKESDKAKAQEAAKKANKAIAAATIKKNTSAPPKLNEEDAKKYTKEQNDAADNIIKDAISDLEKNMQDANSDPNTKLMGDFYKELINAIKNNKPIILKMVSTQQEKITIFDTKLAAVAFSSRLGFLSGTLSSFQELVDFPIEEINNMSPAEMHTALMAMKQGVQDGIRELEKQLSDATQIKKDNILSSKKSLNREEYLDEIDGLLLLISKNATAPITKKYNEAKQISSSMINKMQKCKYEEATSAITGIMTSYMNLTTKSYNEIIDFANFLYTEAIGAINKL